MLGGGADDIHAHLEQLHTRIKDDYTVRWEIDCFLLALHFNPTHPPRWMVLDPADAFHYYNLPDIVYTIRNTLMGLCPAQWLQKLFNVFLCGKRYRRLVSANVNSCQLTAAIINTLHGLLLGLYPFNERRSDLQKRAAIAGAMRAVLTEGAHARFIAQHPNLLCLSLAEYILNTIHDFCPVEWALLGITTGGRSQCLASIESFREASVNPAAGQEDFWPRLEADAQPVVAMLVKFFRDASLYQHRTRSVLPTGMADHLSLALQSRVIHNSSSIFGQLKCAIPGIQFRESEALEEIWTTVYMRQLPAHTTCKQIESLEKIGRMCHLIEEESHHFPLCLLCALTRRTDIMKATFRYDTVADRLVCNECMSHEAVTRINMLGRVLYVRDKAVVLCDACLRPRYWDAHCGCAIEESIAAETCCVCDNPNVISYKEILDIPKFRIQRVGFCYKHTLSCVMNDATIYDTRALQQELHQKRANQ